MLYFILIEELRPLLEDGFYFRYYFDFRGRLYADSPISYTNSAWFRYCYYYGIYSSEELDVLEASLSHTDLSHFNIILEKSMLATEFPNILYNYRVAKYYVITIFFELGKLFKSKLIEESGGVITTVQFIELGIKYFDTKAWDNLELNDKIIAWSLYFILKELDAQIYTKTPFFKDATASGIQILSLILGVKSPDLFKWVNFTQEDAWYDTYFLIIQQFVQTNPMPQLIKPFFTRKTLKKTIMTYNYNASYLTCWKNFQKEAGMSYGIDSELHFAAQKYFKKFYNYLNWFFFKNNFYANSPKIINIYFAEYFLQTNEAYYKTQDEFFIALKYFVLEKHSKFDRKILGKRVTMTIPALTPLFDEAKTNRALQANVTHIFDAFVLRQIIFTMGKPYMSIHDSIGIDIADLKEFNSAVKKAYMHLYTLNIFNLQLQNTSSNFIKSNFVFL